VLAPVWRTSPRLDDGGGVWGPLSTEGTTIYAGTGNTCSEDPSRYGDSIVALTPDLRMRWHVSTRAPGIEDSDVGGGVAVLGQHAYVSSKRGYFYELDRTNGRVRARDDSEPFARNGGGIATPTGDGTVLLVSGGEKSDSAKDAEPGAVVTAFGLDGAVKYRMESERPLTRYAAFVAGVGFIALDRRLIAFDAASGATLWSAPLGDFAYAAPVVVSSGVCAANDAGDVFAFAPPQLR